MAETREKLHCSVLTPEGPVFEGDVKSVTVPGEDGHLGILKGHAPLLTSLAFGPLRVKLDDDSSEEWFVVGGFLEVFRNKVAVLTEQIERPDSIEVDKVRREMEEAGDDYDAGVLGRAKIRYAEQWLEKKRGY